MPGATSGSRTGGNDRVALVTGGSRGIGRAIVQELLHRGNRVVFTFQNSSEAASRLVASSGGRAAAQQHGLADSDAESAVSSAADQWGRLDTLILNAGEWAGGRLATLPPEEWWQVFEVNVRGAYALCRAALPFLRAAGTGSIVLMSSSVAIQGFPGDTAYAAAKAALIGLCRSLAKEEARYGLRVNVLAPGFVDTDMTSRVGPDIRRGILDNIVLQRAGDPSEIARAAVFLAETATYCTGSVLVVDGGWSL